MPVTNLPLRWSPEECHFDLSAGCNARCIMCSVHQDVPVPVVVSDEFIEAIGRLASHVGAFRIGCSSESLLHPRAIEVFNMLRERGAQVQILTNGKRLNDLADELYNAQVETVRISLDSLDPEVLHTKRGVSLPTLLQGLEKINSLKKNRGSKFPKIGLAVTAMRDTIDELPTMVKFCRDNGIALLDYGYLFVWRLDPWLLSQSPFFAQKDANSMLARAEAIARKNGIHFHPKYFGRKDLVYTGDTNTQPHFADVNYSFTSFEDCTVHKRDAWITASGDVVLCNRVKVGNVLEQEWEEIVSCSKAKSVAAMQGDEKKQFCIKCNTCYIRPPDDPSGHFAEQILQCFPEKQLKELANKELSPDRLFDFFEGALYEFG